METYMELYRCLSRASMLSGRREVSHSGIRPENEDTRPMRPSDKIRPRPVTFDRRTLFVTSIEVLSEQ